MASKRTKFGIELDRLITEYVGSSYQFCLDYGVREPTLYGWIHGRTQLNLVKVAMLAEYFSEKSGKPPIYFAIRLVSNHDTVLTIQKRYDKKTNERRFGKEK